MEQVFRDKIMPSQWFWVIVNNLDKFNDKPEMILNLIEKMKSIKDHRLISSLAVVADAIESGYTKLGKFPDIAWLKVNFKGSVAITVTNEEFSMQLLESLERYLNQEFLKQELLEKVVESENPDLNDLRKLTKDLVSFTDKSEELPEQTKERLINSYDDYSANFKGLKTHIKPVDDVIGVLGYQSISVFAAPSGHGKSTFALSVAYYAAITGMCVDYLSFEIPEKHFWFNMVSIESEGTPHQLKSSDMKENMLSEEEKEYYKDHMRTMLGKIGASGGFLNVLDQDTMNFDTYEGMCAKLESVAEKRKRKADLIIVDNVDNLQILKSSERDETTRVNNYIVSLDGFSKKYYNGEGTTILLLSQVNRPALKKLHSTESEDGEKRTKVDVTCIQRFNALYEKATCVLIGYADEVSRSQDTMKIHPVKLRNRAIPLKPITVSVKFAFSKIKGEFALNKMCGDGEEGKKRASKAISGWIKENTVGISDKEAQEIDAELMEGLDEF